LARSVVTSNDIANAPTEARGDTMSNTLKDEVQRRYGQHAVAVTEGRPGGCGCGCGPEEPAALSCCDPVSSNLYDASEASAIPAEAVLASLGCGNPTALTSLNPGEVVLDLGSGGGIDVLLSARRVGPTGKAYGLDMTDEMLALAEENKRKSGLTNVEFLRGEIEHIPLPDDSVDVIISNCVINLSADKDQVLREAFRVLKPGGRFAVSDIVTRGEIPPAIRRNVELWVGCIAGALDEEEYLSKLRAAGFADASIEPTRVYRVAEAREFLDAKGIDADAVAASVDEKFYSGFIRAVKP
jgi:ubiquinone/menaquinone biosynthesis C-methylase UbiE